MLEQFKLRAARRADKRKITKLLAELDADLTEEQIGHLIESRRVMVLKGKQKKGISAVFTYTVLGLVGIFSLLYVHQIAVDKNLRKRGVGSLVLGKIKDFARQRGDTGFFLWSRRFVRGFYTKNRLSGLGRLFWWRRK